MHRDDASQEALFRYGPVVYFSRCFDKEEYNASVRKLMERYPKISRELAEQEIHEFLFSATDYMAKQTPERIGEGPQESELKEGLPIGDKLLVIAWVLILVPSVAYIAQQTFVATDGFTVDPVNAARLESLAERATEAAAELEL